MLEEKKMGSFLLDIKDFLDEKVLQYNNPGFIECDPICVPHRFSKKEDIEISGFIAATLAWGKRTTTIKKALYFISLMDETPFDFMINHRESDLKVLQKFVHRTFNGQDAIFFVQAMQVVYQKYGGLEALFLSSIKDHSVFPAIHRLHDVFSAVPHEKRSMKHVANPAKGSAAKRINMYLRWMVRNDNYGVDFGLWKSISPSVLSCPLDLHSGNVARKLGLLTRKQSDRKAVLELDEKLRILDPEDPVKYDFALFGLGVFERFK